MSSNYDGFNPYHMLKKKKNKRRKRKDVKTSAYSKSLQAGTWYASGSCFKQIENNLDYMCKLNIELEITQLNEFCYQIELFEKINGHIILLTFLGHIIDNVLYAKSLASHDEQKDSEELVEYVSNLTIAENKLTGKLELSLEQSACGTHCLFKGNLQRYL